MKLQFRLRTLMIVVTLLAVPLGYIGWQAKIVRERKAELLRIKSIGGITTYSGERQPNGPPVRTLPWIHGLLGDVPINRFFLPVTTPLATRREIGLLFPEMSPIQAFVGDVDAETFEFADFPEVPPSNRHWQKSSPTTSSNQ